MAGGLTFEQVKRARVFAWHELHTSLPTTPCCVWSCRSLRTQSAAPAIALPMNVRPSNLRGTEHLLDRGWHHLDDCTCPLCSPRKAKPRIAPTAATAAAASCGVTERFRPKPTTGRSAVYRPDDIDRQIVTLLLKDGRMSGAALARAAGVRSARCITASRGCWVPA